MASIEFRAAAESCASPERVLAAARDFTERRAVIWPNVKAGHFEVHASAETFAEVTEELWPVGFWERCRYEWHRPGSVKATVLASNVLEPGSTWELIATPTDEGSHVEAVFQRGFARGPRGRIAEVVNRIAAPRLAGSDLRRVLAVIESLPAVGTPQ